MHTRSRYRYRAYALGAERPGVWVRAESLSQIHANTSATDLVEIQRLPRREPADYEPYGHLADGRLHVRPLPTRKKVGR